MKVNMKEPKEISFDKINIGSLFYYNNPYMKIDTVIVRDDDIYNSISLTNGILTYFDDNALVQRLEGELNVKFWVEE